MTREEAIEWLKDIKETGCETMFRDWSYEVALDIAIESLSAEPSGDLISRADAINAIENTDWYHNANGEMIQGATSYNAWYKAEDIYKALNELPSADRPQGK